jgi:two-component system NtrC family sensor kinase
MMEESMITRERKAEEKPSSSRSPTVLIVDDQPETLEALRRLLRNEPVKLMTFTSAREGLQWITQNRVDLVIADERMPEMRGTDLLELVRERSPETVRVILTGYPGSATVAHGLTRGVDWLISKPWNDDALKLTIRQLLGGRDLQERLPNGAESISGDSPPRPSPRWEGRLADFFEQAPLPLHCIGPDGVILWANSAELAFLGYAKAEYIGHPISEFHVDKAAIEDILQRLSRNETLRDHEARLRCKDGTIKDVLIDSSVLWEDGQFLHARCVIRDNTATRRAEEALQRSREELESEVEKRMRVLRDTNGELLREIADRKRAEDTLRLSEMRFRLLMDGVKDYAILMLSTEGIVVSWNDGAERINGFTAEEILGRPFSILYVPEDVTAGKPERLLEAAAKEGRVEEEGWRLRKDGTRFWSKVVVTALRDSSGGLLGFSKVTRDMTERRKAEEERARLSAQMLQGQKLQAIGQLSAGIAHEINNPVGYILSNLNTMGEYCRDLQRLLACASSAATAHEEGKDPSGALAEFTSVFRETRADQMLGDLREVVSDCKLGGERIRDIVRSLREFSHVDEGELKPTDLNKCLEDALRICWNELKYKAEIHKDYQELPLVPCYSQRLGQVFINLLVNAAQAIEKKGEVFLSTRIEAGEVVIRVRDTGCGIEPEHLRKVFEPFFTTKTVGSGTGLGLHVAYKIIVAHRGRIEVKSKVGEGTEFTVRLPVEGPRGGQV